MKIKLYILTFLILITSVQAVFSQNVDSLKQILNTQIHDTVRCNVLNKLLDLESDDKIWPGYNDKVKEICERNLKVANLKDPQLSFYLKYLANSFNNKGFLANQNGDITKALEYFQSCLKIQEKSTDKAGFASTLSNVGAIYRNQGDIPKGLEYYFRSLKIHEEIKNQKGIAISLNNIGAIYKNQGLIQKALDCFNRCLIIQNDLKDETGIARSLNNIGFIYQMKGDLNKALRYYQMSLKKYEKLNSKQGTANTLKNIGSIYLKRGDAILALECFNKSLKLQEEIKDKMGIAQAYISIGRAMLDLNKTNEALENAKQALKISQELGFPELISGSSVLISKIYAEKGNYKEAYEMFTLHKQMADSMNNEASRKISVQKTFQYTYEKKALADSIKVNEERIGFELKTKQEKTQRTILYTGIGLIALFSIFMYNRFRVTRKQKHIIELQKIEVDKQKDIANERREVAETQKHIIEEKQKEIIDSIHYAKRIQQAVLTSEDYIESNFCLDAITGIKERDFFIFYQPKDIVSGDFYWATMHHNKFYFAAADCTGHGVPGAFMSLLNVSFLNENVIEKGLQEPAEILNEQRNAIIKALNPNGNENSKDGMDCALCSFDLENNKMQFALANNPLWLVRHNELIEFKADKMPVGKYDEITKSFTPHSIELQKGDIIYLTTDGYADQFGGDKGKKFKYRQLKELLLYNSHKPMSEQKGIITNSINNWKGKLEQVDDILIIGIKV